VREEAPPVVRVRVRARARVRVRVRVRANPNPNPNPRRMRWLSELISMSTMRRALLGASMCNTKLLASSECAVPARSLR
jgi:hypothetical protein